MNGMKSAMHYAWGSAARNKVLRVGQQHGSVRIVKDGADGNAWGRCDSCGSERLYTKSQFRCGTVRCCPPKTETENAS